MCCNTDLYWGNVETVQCGSLLCNINQSINQSIDRSINQITIAPIYPAEPGTVAQQPDRCSNTKLLRLFRNINRPLGPPVSKAGRPSRKVMFWDVFWGWQPRWLNGQIVEGCSKEKGHMSWRPLSQCWSWSWGWTEWFLCLFSVSVMEEKWQSRSEGKRVVPHEEPCSSVSRPWNGLYILLVANEGSAAVEHCE